MDQDELRLSFRCDKRWDDLDGEGPRRHCATCDHEVVDLSAHTELGARVRLALHTGSEPPCVRYEVRDRKVRFRRSRLTRMAAAMVAMLPVVWAEPARGGEIDDVDAEPGQVHVCSSLTNTLMGRVAWRFPRIRLWNLRPHGDSRAHVAADMERFRRVAVRCKGTPLPKRARLRHGEAFFHDLPDGKSCEVRLKGPGRPMTVRFVAGAAQTDVRVED